LHRAWEALETKYFPKTAPMANALSKQFHDLKHKLGTDPDIWITKLEDIKIRLASIGKAYVMPDEQFMAHVINNVSKDYESTVDFLGQRMEDANNPLTLEEARGHLMVWYQCICSQDTTTEKGSNDDNEDEKDIALFVKRTFKGKCNKCGKIGHKSVDCRVTNTDSYRYNNNNNNTNNANTRNNNGNYQGNNSTNNCAWNNNGHNRNNNGNYQGHNSTNNHAWNNNGHNRKNNSDNNNYGNFF
jgi:gag-polypeptide of LTR copia-type/Zinc knuckle